MSEPKLTEAEVRHVATLARLALSDEEIATMRSELDAILRYMDELSALDVDDVEPTFHAVPMEAPLREDLPVPSLTRDEALAGAPKSEDGAFAVPKVLDV